MQSQNISECKQEMPARRDGNDSLGGGQTKAEWEVGVGCGGDMAATWVVDAGGGLGGGCSCG